MKSKKKMSMYKGGGKMSMYAGGGKMPMYVFGGKVYDDGGSLMEALLKNPEQRAKAKKMLGM